MSTSTPTLCLYRPSLHLRSQLFITSFHEIIFRLKTELLPLYIYIYVCVCVSVCMCTAILYYRTK